MTKPLPLLAMARAADGPWRAAAPPPRSQQLPGQWGAGEAPGEPGSGQGGDEQPPLTLDAIYRRHAATVTRWVAHLVGRDVEIEDVVHEIFLVVHKRLPTFRGDSSITTWLYGVAIRVVADRRRGRRWRRRFGLAGGGREGTDLANQRAAGPSALELLETQEARRIVYEVLDRLSEVNRTALIMFEIEGLSGQEIAAITGTSVDRVWTRLHRARKQFTRQFLAWEKTRNDADRRRDPATETKASR